MAYHKRIDWADFERAWDAYRFHEVTNIADAAKIAGLSTPTFTKRLNALFLGQNNPEWWSDYDGQTKQDGIGL